MSNVTCEWMTEADSAGPEVDARCDRVVLPHRRERIEHIRSQISDGTYLTRAKLHAAIDRLIGEIRSARTTNATE